MAFSAGDGTRFFLHVASLAPVVICLDQVHRISAFGQVALGTQHVFRGSRLYLFAVLVKVVANAAIFDSGLGVVLIVIKRHCGAGEMPESAVIDLFDIFLGKAAKSCKDDSGQRCGQAPQSKSFLHRDILLTPDRVFP